MVGMFPTILIGIKNYYPYDLNQRTLTMAKRSSFQRRAGVVLAVFLIATFISITTVYTKTVTLEKRPDIVMIDLPIEPGGDKMPGVQFLHDLHLKALEGKKDCSACHFQNDNKLVFNFKRLKNTDVKTDMDIYHDNCINCHKETLSSGNPAGPVTGDCRSCHKTTSNVVSSWQPINIDKSLHYRHESSKLIQPIFMEEKVNCCACHHKYDKVSQKTFYKKGEEETCLYCHKSEDTKDARSLRSASHDSCINCHKRQKSRSQEAGPVNCKGCHDSAEQMKIKTVKKIPRIKRNQPDEILLASWMAKETITKDSVKKQMNPVAFNHKNHEENSASCKSCHHASLQRCGECHIETGVKKGGYVPLEKAMHNSVTQKSCMGCHRKAQTAKNCAGCHAMMPEKNFAQANCEKCHTVDKRAIRNLPMNKRAKTELARKTLKATSLSSAMISDDLIPETVTINTMMKEYKAAKFPHRRIVKKLAANMKKDKMANFFHGEATNLCTGCHHNSPASVQPPRCASCHGSSFKAEGDGRPGLKGAYHGQCITCHKLMKIEKPSATDCISCHKKNIQPS